jgi:uncharacterized protein YoxC
MDRNRKREDGKDDSLILPSSSELRGRQSVRATFKLTEKAIDAVSIVAAHLGIKQKSLFDHLIDDVRSLNSIADEIESDTFSQLHRIQKTYVISRKALCCLDETSRNLNAPRDALVEYSIKRLMPVISEEREKHLHRKKMLAEIDAYLKQGEEILKKSKKLLSDEDPLYDKFETAMAAFRNAHSSIASYVEKGKKIEDY